MGNGAMNKSLRLLGRLFGKAKSDQQIGETSLLDSFEEFKQNGLELLVPARKGFADRIIRSLKSSEGWPFDLGDGTPDASEQTVLNLWGFTLGHRMCNPDVSGDEKTAFIDLVCNWFLSPSVLKRPKPDGTYPPISKMLPPRRG
jgi:hypothetical protein